MRFEILRLYRGNIPKLSHPLASNPPCCEQIPANVFVVSAVELAVRNVRKLSDRQACELLGWLAKRQLNGTARMRRAQASRRRAKARRSMLQLKTWHDSVRGTTDWEPPRMPDDLVKPIRL